MLTAISIPVSAEEMGSFVCSIKGSPIAAITASTLYAPYRGARYYFSSNQNRKIFLENPAKYAADAAKSPGVKAAFLFDPVSTRRLPPEKAVAHSDYKRVRFFFSSTQDKEKFDNSPVTYAVPPNKESLLCPAQMLPVGSYGGASDYSDFDGIRYFFCCAGCKEKFDANPARHLIGYEDRLNHYHLSIRDYSAVPPKSNTAK